VIAETFPFANSSSPILPFLRIHIPLRPENGVRMPRRTPRCNIGRSRHDRQAEEENGKGGDAKSAAQSETDGLKRDSLGI